MDNKQSTPSQGAIIFDLDGTLADTSEDIAASVNFVRRQEKLEPLSTKDVLKEVGTGAAQLIRETLQLVDTSENKRLPTLLDTFQQHYLEHQGEQSRLYPGISDALATLANRFDLYVLSNKRQDATQNEVLVHGVHHLFKAIWGAGAFPDLKPNPIGIETALARSGVDKSRALMVGDLFVDMQTGVNAGIRTIHVTWGFGSLGPDDPIPSASIASATALPDTIDRLLG